MQGDYPIFNPDLSEPEGLTDPEDPGFSPDDYDAPSPPVAATDYLEGLTPEQYRVATELDGAVLALAGAGTGKTRALTARIAHILRTGQAKPWEILAVTFTNRVAREMAERVEKMTGNADSLPWLGTFHSIGVKLLRRHAELVGLSSNFVILDTDDTERLAKQILEENGVDIKKNPPKVLLYLIDRWKNKGLFPNEVLSSDISDAFNGKALDYYATYQERLTRSGAVDFGDLILLNIRLFKENPDILDLYHRRFRHILADEYQDTNTAQYLWLRLLAQGGGHICCVGDDDQSIYGWRGAEVGNILRFEQDFKNAKIIRMERNYRSAPAILTAASGLISHNEGRLGKNLRAEGVTSEERVQIWGMLDGDDEARQIVERIEDYHRDGEAFGEMAVLTRTSAQMRAIEERLVACAVPYRVYGGLKFYERAEVRDITAYLRIIAQPHDDLAFERALSKPKRGLGDAALRLMRETGREMNLSAFAAAEFLLKGEAFKGKKKIALSSFIEDIKRWSALQGVNSVGEIVQTAVEESGYADMLRADKNREATGRLDNLKELARSAEGFENLAGFLEHAALIAEASKEVGERGVVLMTLHAAKGLEFDTVFLPGWEEGLFPSQRTLDESGKAGLEEERRLAYVGLTRARKRAIVSYASGRRIYNRWQNALPSRFIAEIPEAATQKQGSGFAGSPRGGGSRFDGYSGYASQQTAHAFESEYQTPGWQRAKEKFLQQKRGVSEASYEIIPPKPKNETTAAYKIGDGVKHPRLGFGRVIDIYQDRLTIEFENEGVKQVFAKFVSPADFAE